MSKETNADGSDKKGGKKGLIICIAIILILVGVVIALLFRKNGEAEPPGRNVVVDRDNVQNVIEEMISQEPTPAGYYEVVMNSTWHFKNGKTASDDAYVENTQTNTNAVYFDVTRSDTGATVLASPILPVGTHMEGITLDEELPAGTYDCVCTYYLIDEQNQPVSQVNVGLTIVVDN